MQVTFKGSQPLKVDKQEKNPGDSKARQYMGQMNKKQRDDSKQGCGEHGMYEKCLK